MLSPPVVFGAEVFDSPLLLDSDLVELDGSLFALDEPLSVVVDSLFVDDFDSLDDSLLDSVELALASDPLRCAFLP